MTKLSELAATAQASALTGGEELLALQSGQDVVVSVNQIKAFANPGVLTTTQMANVTTDQVKALTSTAAAALAHILPLGSLSTSQIAGLTAAIQSVPVTTSQIPTFTSTQIGIIQTSQMASLTTTQVTGLSTIALTTTQISAMPANSHYTSQIAGLVAAIQAVPVTSTQLPTLTTTQVGLLTTSQISGLGTLATLSAVTTSQVTGLGSAAMTTTQMNGLTTTSMAALTTTSLLALAADFPVNAFSTSQISGYSSGGGSVTTTALAAFTTTQIAALPNFAVKFDPYWSQVTFLPRGTASNSVTDQSGNALTITNTSVTTGTSTPVSKQDTYWMSFNGTSSSLIVSSPGGAAKFTGNYTIEAWVYPNALPGTFATIFSCQVANDSTGFNIGILSSGALRWNDTAGSLISGGSVPAGAWSHIAFVQNGTTLTAFVNGASIGSATVTPGFSDGALLIGVAYNSVYFWNGYITGLRITNGAPRYTANFTPPVNPFLTSGAL